MQEFISAMEMSTPLSTCEKTGTKIMHRSQPTEATIVGSYPGGFRVQVTEDGQVRDLMLPFRNIDQWVVQ